MNKISYYINFIRIEWRRRRAKKRGRKLRLKIGNLKRFFSNLNQQNVDYVVLRWFDEVPTTVNLEKTFQQDVDILFAVKDLKKLVKIAANHPGTIPFDCYSAEGKRGSATHGYPYYPPFLAYQILKSKTLHKGVFHIPSPKLHCLSLIFHIIYHKGETSGLPFDAISQSSTKGHRKYAATIQELAHQCQLKLPKEISLESLSLFLRSHQFDMAFDLKQRWKLQTRITRKLAKLESNTFRHLQNLPDLVCFYIRSDASENHDILKTTLTSLGSYFRQTEVFELSKEDISRVLPAVRGGNWIEHKANILVPPTHLVIARFLKEPYSRYLEKTPPINKIKLEIRQSVIKSFPNSQCPRVLHGSDNALEAHHHLFYGLGKHQYDQYCQTILQAENNQIENKSGNAFFPDVSSD
jgi:hypothetical protein